MKQAVYKTYIALARGEHWSASEIGATKDFVGAYSGRLIDSFPLTQINWTESGELKEAVCKAWDLSEEQFDSRLITEKPSHIQNLVICSELRRLFGNLGFVEGFDRDGIFILPKERGFIVPQIKEGKIESLKFYGLGVLRIWKKNE